MGSLKCSITCSYDRFQGKKVCYVDTICVDCYSTFQLLLVHNNLLPSDIEMDSSSLIKAFGSSFMDSLVLLNVQRQKRQFLAALCSLTTNIK